MGPLALSLALVTPVGAAHAQAAPPPQPHLDTALRTALSAQPAVTESSARAQVAGYDLRRAQSRHWPRLGLEAGRDLNGSQDKATTQTAKATLNLWSGGAMEGLVKQNEASFDAARLRVTQTCADNSLRIADAWIERLRARSLAQRAQEHLADLERLRAMVEEIARVDRGRRSDVDQVITRQELVRLAAFDAAALARNTQIQLQRLLGFEAEPPDGELEWLQTAPLLQHLPASLPEASRLALDANAEVAASRSDEAAARAAIEVAKGARWPQLDLVVQRVEERSQGVRTLDHGVQVQTGINLFSGGNDYYAERASAQAVVAAQARSDNARREAELAVSQSWEAWDLARRRAGIGDVQIRAARNVLEAQREMFRLGKRSMLDLLSASADLNTVLVSVIQARHDEALHALRLQVRTGHLATSLSLPSGSACAAGGPELPASMLGWGGTGR